jgi:hypothetical protein
VGKAREKIYVDHFFSGRPPGLRSEDRGPMNILLFSQQLSNCRELRKSGAITNISGSTMKDLTCYQT